MQNIYSTCGLHLNNLFDHDSFGLSFFNISLEIFYSNSYEGIRMNVCVHAYLCICMQVFIFSFGCAYMHILVSKY